MYVSGFTYIHIPEGLLAKHIRDVLADEDVLCQCLGTECARLPDLCRSLSLELVYHNGRFEVERYKEGEYYNSRPAPDELFAQYVTKALADKESLRQVLDLGADSLDDYCIGRRIDIDYRSGGFDVKEGVHKDRLEITDWSRWDAHCRAWRREACDEYSIALLDTDGPERNASEAEWQEALTRACQIVYGTDSPPPEYYDVPRSNYPPWSNEHNDYEAVR